MMHRKKKQSVSIAESDHFERNTQQVSNIMKNSVFIIVKLNKLTMIK